MNIPSDARRDPMAAATAHAQLGKTASSFLAGKHQLFIDGKSIDAKSGKKFDVFDPATGLAIAAVAEADKADVDEAVKAARRAFRNRPVVEDLAARPQQADLEARRPSRKTRRRNCAGRSARRWQADPRCAQCRPARLLRDPALHGRLGN